MDLFNLGRIKQLLVLLTVLIVTACSPKPTTIDVELMWQQQPLGCDQLLPELRAWRLDQFQFYLSSFSNNGTAINLDSVGQAYQQPRVALMGGDCGSPGNWQLVFEGQLQEGELSFDLGVPFELNHLNPLTADSPLNQSDMFWTWQNGHKFLRLDLTKKASQKIETFTAQNLQTGWQFHLGSTACQSASVMRAPTVPCGYPNRPRIKLDYQKGSRLVLDLAPLLSGIIDDAELAKHSCMSDPNTRVCQQLFARLGFNGDSKVWRLQQ